MNKKKVRKASRRTKLKKKLWNLTSEYVRRRDSYNGRVKCCTCGIEKEWKGDGMQAGHFIPQAQGDAVRFDLRNIHPQCYRCNINLGGNGAEYYPYMVKRYGQEAVDKLRYLSNRSVKFTESDFEDMIEDMEKRISELDQT